MKLIKIIFMAVVLLPMSAFAGQYSGLWIGQIEVSKVNEVTSKVDATTAKAVKNTFDLQILLHADAADQVRLLRAVTLMQKTYQVDQDGQTIDMVRRVRGNHHGPAQG
ncbi:MAG: hypothetical protein GY795_01390 [Desulfobacterales bacterium]|nr:hypothetical protein [Desulfobacterales bacterium]